MGDTAARKAVVLELFAATGESIPENDPIVTGAILFSHKLNEVATLSASHMRAAGEDVVAAIHQASQISSRAMLEASQRCVVESAAATAEADVAAQAATAHLTRLAAERIQLVKTIETQVVKAVKLVAKGESGPLSLRYIPAWYAVVGALVGAVALAIAWNIGVIQGTARAEEAAVGRAFSRVVPALDQKLRDQLMEHLRKKAE
jgi:hypothetical protein